jgi:DNA-binding NarL/FixJ family response regulator
MSLENVYFTKRQRAVLQAIVDGYTTRKDIADHLGMEPSTVRNHLTTIYDKAGVRRLPALQRELQRMGWTEQETNAVTLPAVEKESVP